jgi:hypothetical protein
MAIGWISLTISAGIGIAGGILSGLVSCLVGRFSVNRKIRKKVADVDKQIHEKCNEEFETRQSILYPGNRECFGCEMIIPMEAVFCAFCGVPVKGPKKCSDCKIPLPDNAVACYICGKKIIEPDVDEKSADNPT